MYFSASMAALPDRNPDDFINGVREGPVEARFQYLGFAYAHGFPESEFYSNFIGLNREGKAIEKCDSQAHNQEFYNFKAAIQGLVQSTGTGVIGCLRNRRDTLMSARAAFL